MAELRKAGLSLRAGDDEFEQDVATDLMPPPDFKLDNLDNVPLASGSIAQVHTAFCGAERVVVKVRHPRVAEELLLDFELMRFVAQLAHDWVPALRWLNAPATVTQFEAAMVGQCDLTKEAEHLDAFRFNFRRKSAWMVFPRVLYATPGVLVETFEHGELASDFVRRAAEVVQKDAHFVIARGEDVYLQMLLVDNFMHADLHPGNLVFRKSGLLGKPQLVLLDGGMAAHLSVEERRNFIGLLQSIGDGDGGSIADRVLRFSRKPRGDAAAFSTDVQAMCSEKCRGYGTGLDIGEVVREIMQLMYKHSVSIDGNYATLIANMMCLEGMARDLEPKFNVLDVAYPFLRAHQLLGDRVFQRAFSVAQWVVPLSVWELTYRLTLYAALHGETLKRFQI